MCSRSPPLSGLYRPLLCVFETEAVGHGTAIDRLMALASAIKASGKFAPVACTSPTQFMPSPFFTVYLAIRSIFS